MSKECKICGYSGPTVMRNGKCCCGACGTEVPVEPQVNFNSSFSSSNTFSGGGFSSGAPQTPQANDVPINATCPICKNSNGNTLKDGKAHCSLCGSSFDFAQPVFDPMGSYSSSPNFNAKKIEELEREKSNKITWGIIFIILFWPIGVYNFYKAYKISQEIENLKR
ncbi:MAG: hypothetical protein E7623_06150 [Ruminococcaceae bacterium]|nr:hypothetical protein [Oscillospiraceae bacterium]